MPATVTIEAMTLDHEYAAQPPICWKDLETLLRCQPDGIVELNVRSGEHRRATEFVVDGGVI
jgi:hypothetical protein